MDRTAILPYREDDSTEQEINAWLPQRLLEPPRAWAREARGSSVTRHGPLTQRKGADVDVGILLLFDGRPGLTLGDCARRAKELEDMGFPSLWVPDHVVTFENYQPLYSYSPDGLPPWTGRQGWYDPLWVLAAAASTTSRIRLGTSVVILPERNPVLFAKEVVALDHLSNGRVDIGVGVGWCPEEYAALGVPFERRGDRADEYITAMRRLWTEDLATMHGEFVDFTDVVALPKPIQRPSPPLIVGGQSPAAFRRVAKQGDGWISWMLPPDQLKRSIDALNLECERHDRDPATVRKIGALLYSGADDMRRYFEIGRENGMHEYVVLPWASEGYPSESIAEIAQYRDD